MAETTLAASTTAPPPPPALPWPLCNDIGGIYAIVFIFVLTYLWSFRLRGAARSGFFNLEKLKKAPLQIWGTATGFIFILSAIFDISLLLAPCGSQLTGDADQPIAVVYPTPGVHLASLGGVMWKFNCSTYCLAKAFMYTFLYKKQASLWMGGQMASMAKAFEKERMSLDKTFLVLVAFYWTTPLLMGFVLVGEIDTPIGCVPMWDYATPLTLTVVDIVISLIALRLFNMPFRLLKAGAKENPTAKRNLKGCRLSVITSMIHLVYCCFQGGFTPQIIAAGPGAIFFWFGHYFSLSHFADYCANMISISITFNDFKGKKVTASGATQAKQSTAAN